MQATPDWLYPSAEEIQKHYDIGKKQCNDYLRDHAGKFKKWDELGGINPDMKSYPWTGNTKCRGTGDGKRLLHGCPVMLF
jgi:hypothetical protein